jgi:hypothetical protein
VKLESPSWLANWAQIENTQLLSTLYLTNRSFLGYAFLFFLIARFLDNVKPARPIMLTDAKAMPDPKITKLIHDE